MASLEENDNVQLYVNVDPLAKSPKEAWEKLEKTQNFSRLHKREHVPLSEPIYPDKLRIVCTSDTHSLKFKNEPSSRFHLPPGDVLIHAGDFCMNGTLKEAQNFNALLGTLDYKYKIFIAGNHDLLLEDGWPQSAIASTLLETENISDLFTNGIYLQDQSVNVCGINIYGTPWNVSHGCPAFGLQRGHPLLTRWCKIPSNTDILITHMPPIGYGDKTHSKKHVGCVDLLNIVQKIIKPKYHIFGHIHEGYGVYSDGTTTFINASACVRGYVIGNPPVLFDIPLPEGCSKDMDPVFSKERSSELKIEAQNGSSPQSSVKSAVKKFEKLKLKS